MLPLAATTTTPLEGARSSAHLAGTYNGADSLPDVFPGNDADLIASRLRKEALHKFALHQLPETKEAWTAHRTHLQNEIIKKAGIVIDHTLPLNYAETGTVKAEGITVKNIIFQTRPGVYATANLYIPDGKGPFPAIVNMHGHWKEGRLSGHVQARGQSLARNGYVCLSIDAFGSGERTTVHGTYEYHGANLGAHLMNVGETLLGFQVSDNMRAVDLLCSLPYVDADNIGATGASGGGNQTMWLAAIDDRIKASMPVVSVGTFESAVMRSNCICELLVDGLTFTEASGVLALVAPRAIKMCNHKQDRNPTFYPAEMLRSYRNAKSVFEMLGVENNIYYELFDLEHGYWPENRQAMLGWFDLHLKGEGTGAAKEELAFQTLPEEQLMVYPKGERPAKVENIADYCRRSGNELRTKFLSEKTIDADQKKNALRDILRINEEPQLKKVHQYTTVDGWDRFALETSDNKLIPVLHKSSGKPSADYVIICDPRGKKGLAPALLDEIAREGKGIVVFDLSGTGETSSPPGSGDGLKNLHTLSRAELWLGRTILGEWVKELQLVARFTRTNLNARNVRIDGSREGALAALFLTALEADISEIKLREAPVSFLFDAREGIDFFTMAAHLPGFLVWGDISLAAALSGAQIKFIHPVTMSGNKVTDENIKRYSIEFDRLRAACRKPGQTLFMNGDSNR